MSARDPKDVIRLVTAPNPAQAHIWQTALENEGIDAKVVGDFLDAGIGDVSGVEAEVWVHREDEKRALAVLGESGVRKKRNSPPEGQPKSSRPTKGKGKKE